MVRQGMLWLAVLGWTLGPAYGQYENRIEVFRGDGAYLGVRIRDLNEVDVRKLQLSREAGVFVEGVEKGSPADEADLQKGDIIWEYAGSPVLSVRQLRRLVAETPMGRRVELTLRRGDERLKTTARIGRRRHSASSTDVRIPETRIKIPDFLEGHRRFFFFSDRPRLGITAGQLTEQMADFLGVAERKGVLVMEVVEGSPAHEAGLKAGDVIVSIDGEKVENPHDLSSRLEEGTHQVTIVRGGSPESVEVRIESRSQKGEKVSRM